MQADDGSLLGEAGDSLDVDLSDHVSEARSYMQRLLKERTLAAFCMP